MRPVEIDAGTVLDRVGVVLAIALTVVVFYVVGYRAGRGSVIRELCSKPVIAYQWEACDG